MIRQGLQEHFRDEYRKLRPHWKDSLTHYRELVAENLPLGGKVLDVGCGHADWLAMELARAGLVCGTDADIRGLRRNVTHMHLVAARGEQLPFREGAFDLVTMAWVLEHLEHPPTVLREIRRVLRPGGRLVFLTPNAWNYNVWLIRVVPNSVHEFFTRRLYGRQERDTYPVRYRLNSPRALDRALGEAGFSRRRLMGNGDPSYISFNSMLFALARGIERLLELRPLRRAQVHLLGVYET
jgi:SAM-dependent methyltransferase